MARKKMHPNLDLYVYYQANHHNVDSSFTCVRVLMLITSIALRRIIINQKEVFLISAFAMFYFAKLFMPLHKNITYRQPDGAGMESQVSKRTRSMKKENSLTSKATFRLSRTPQLAIVSWLRLLGHNNLII